MNSRCLKDKNTSKIWYIFHIIVLSILLRISIIDTLSYEFIILIIKSSLSLLIVGLIINDVEKENKYITFIGVGYIVSNILDIFGLIVINQQNLLNEINILSSSLETIVFFIAIKYLFKEGNYERKKCIDYIKSAGLLVGLILFLNLDYVIFNIYKIKIEITTLIYVLNLITLVSVTKVTNAYIKNYDDEINSLKIINNLLIIKIIYFIIKVTASINFGDNRLIETLVDFTSVLQIYLVYKITIKNILIDPYMKILKLNEDIQKNTKNQEDINLLLEKAKDIQDKIKEKLIYKEDFFKAILSSTPNGWVVFDENLNMLYSNKSFERIINHSEGDIYNSMKKNIIDYDKFISNISKAQREQLKIEDSIKTIDNKIYKCINFNDSISTESICLIFDITKEAYRLNSLINLKEEYEDLIKNIKTPVLICDNYNNIVAFSKSCEKDFNEYKLYKSNNEKKLDDENFLDNIHPKDKDIARKVFKMNQKARSNEGLYNNGLFRFSLLKESGEIIWLESKTTVYYEKDVKYKILSYRDITKYMKSKKKLEKMQKIYKRVLDSIPEGIYLEDIESGEYIFINEKFKEIFKTKQKLENKNSSIYRNDIMKIHPDDKRVLYNGIEKTKNDKISDYEDVRYIDNEGNIIEAKAASIPFKLANKVLKLSIIKTMEDIKKLEELKNKIMEREKHDKLKMEFFINMSHELKTPLNLIFTSTQLIESLYLKNNICGYSIKNHIKLTKQNSYRLLKIINNLIDFTKMETGFYNINMQNKDIISIVEDIAMSVVGYADNKGVQIIFDTNEEELIMGIDVNALEIIILNILSNAIKFTNSGGYIYVDLIYKEEIKKIDIIIRDTGIGIPKDKIELIFKRFNDVNKGFVGNINGSGIGLSMVKSMSNLIGAKINAESEYGKGSVFTITLDVKEVEGEDHNYTNSSIENKTLNVERLIVGMEDIYR